MNSTLRLTHSVLVPDLPDWTGSLLPKDASPDVIADTTWQIFGCKNGGFFNNV